jgi:hypothetical protein
MPSSIDWQAIKNGTKSKSMQRSYKSGYSMSGRTEEVHSDESMLEPYVLKGTRTVLRGEGDSNIPDLPDNPVLRGERGSNTLDLPDQASLSTAGDRNRNALVLEEGIHSASIGIQRLVNLSPAYRNS